MKIIKPKSLPDNKRIINHMYNPKMHVEKPFTKIYMENFFLLHTKFK